MASFQDMSPRGQVLLFAVLAAVLFLVGEYALLSGPRAANDATRQEIATVSGQNAVLRPYERRVELLRAENQTLERQLNTVLAIVPNERSTDQFIRDLQSTAARSFVSIRKIEVQPVEHKDFYVAAPYALTLDGGYADLQRFYSNLEGLQRIVNVGALNLKGLGDISKNTTYPFRGDESVSADCTVTTFFSASAAPPSASASTDLAGRKAAR